MTISTFGSSTWVSTPPEIDPSPQPFGWQSTQVQTQAMDDPQDVLAQEQQDIGRQVADNLYELFVTCDAGPALAQQFEYHRPQFIAIHDVATHSSRKLLTAVAAASKSAMQRLVIRRQGFGTTLATLEFVELPTAEGGALRIYSTDAEADTPSRRALARAVLGFSALAAVLVGDLPGPSTTGLFRTLHDDMLHGPWPNRHLLLLPLSAASPLVTQGMELARGTGVNVRATPHVARPADAWNFIASTWARLREDKPSGPPPTLHVVAPASSPRYADPLAAIQRAAGPLPLRPMPEVASRMSDSVAALDPLSRYVQQLSELTGMVSCCVFNVATGQDLAHAGASPGPVDLAEHGSDLLAGMMSISRTLGLGHALPEAAITFGAHHLVLRPVPKHPGLALHAVLDKMHANLTLARLQIMRLDALFDEADA